MRTTTTRLMSATGALLLAGGLAACAGEEAPPTSAEPPPPAESSEPAPPEETEPPEEEAPPEDEASTPAGPDPTEPPSESAPPDAPSEPIEEEPPSEEAPPEDGAGQGATATYEDWLAVPLPEAWVHWEDNYWMSEVSGEGLTTGACDAPDSGVLAFEDCIDYVTQTDDPSSSSGVVETEEIEADPGNLRVTRVTVSGESATLVHWFVENQHTGEVGRLRYYAEGEPDEALIESVSGMSYTG